MQAKELEKFIKPNTPGIELEFESTWVVWKQTLKNIFLNNYHYQEICKFSTIAGFWFFINLQKKSTANRLFIMREGIIPCWEDSSHNDGGQLIITVPTNDIFHNIYVNCLMGMVGESLVNDKYNSTDITGITYIYETNLKQIRFWSSNKKIILDHNKFSLSNIQAFNEISFNLEKNSLFMTFEELKEKNKKNKKIKKNLMPKPYVLNNSYSNYTKRYIYPKMRTSFGPGRNSVSG